MRQPRDLYEFPVEWRDWCTGAGQPASLLWLEGRTWLAGIGTRAEQALLASGAVPIGLLRFDPDPRERVHRDGCVTRLSPRQLLGRLAMP
jgi:hypothetical protein